MSNIKVVGICGSLRAGSFNRKLLMCAKKEVESLGETYTELDLKMFSLPIYDGDMEGKELPVGVKKLKAEVESAQAIIIVSPEYNYSIPGGLKNAIDWLSRCGKNSLNGKLAVIMGASTGPFGTVRGQAHLRQTLSCLNVMLLPQPQVLIPFADKAFNEDGTLKDEKTSQMLQKLIKASIKP